MTLIEVLVALTILAIVAVVLLTAIATTYKGASLAQERTTAESLVRTQLEAVKNADYQPEYDPIADVPPGYEVAVEVTPLAGHTQKIKVTISHWGKQVFVVENYKEER